MGSRCTRTITMSSSTTTLRKQPFRDALKGPAPPAPLSPKHRLKLAPHAAYERQRVSCGDTAQEAWAIPQYGEVASEADASGEYRGRQHEHTKAEPNAMTETAHLPVYRAIARRESKSVKPTLRDGLPLVSSIEESLPVFAPTAGRRPGCSDRRLVND
ncbi:hypothetical protein V495_00187 [Pseudogymnoascus sp. VKM F-4514 (FW-929)]|nr:hypothetical protein V495_00187 [Pseudogymnoascus sp. VKM F-4514 (FW-929)]KFY67305.1 hypothetical protein V497_00418 [Pseudogymnoascus sp. VKM F-4516 (FW-969)]